MKKTRKIICVALVAATILSLFWLPSNASSFATTGNRTISPTDRQLRAGENPKYRNLIETIDGEINQISSNPGNPNPPHEAYVYHYIVPASGEYFIYTTGSVDTIGRLYKYHWRTGFTALTGEIDDNTYSAGRTTYTNFFTRINLEQGDNIYIVIRAYGAGYGRYQLHIEPYRDMLVSSQGRVWEKDELSLPDLSAIDITSAIFWENRIWYANADQTSALYNFLTDRTIKNLIDTYYRYESVGGVLRRAAEIGVGVISLLSYSDLIGTAGSFAISYVSSIVKDWCESYFKYPAENEARMAFIENACTLVPNYTHRVDEYGHTWNGTEYCALHGIIYRTEMGWSWRIGSYQELLNLQTQNRPRSYYMSKCNNPSRIENGIGVYDSNTMYGEPFEHGSWRFSETETPITGECFMEDPVTGAIVLITSQLRSSGPCGNGRNQLY